MDEDDHIYHGYVTWKHGDLGLNPEHAPLRKLVAAWPLLPMPIKMPPLQSRFFNWKDFLGGEHSSSKRRRRDVRLAVSLRTVLLAALVFLAANEIFEPGAGFIALIIARSTRTFWRTAMWWERILVSLVFFSPPSMQTIA